MVLNKGLMVLKIFWVGLLVESEFINPEILEDVTIMYPITEDYCKAYFCRISPYFASCCFICQIYVLFDKTRIKCQIMFSEISNIKFTGKLTGNDFEEAKR